MTTKAIPTLLRWLFILTAIEAAASILALSVAHREGSWMSLWRGAGLAFLAASLVTASLIAHSPPRCLSSRPQRRVIAGLSVLVLGAGGALFLLRYLEPETLLPYYERSKVVLLFILVAGGESLAAVLVLRYSLAKEAADLSGLLLPVGASIFALAAGFALVALTRLGITPDSAYWGEPGVPILGWQLVLAILSGLAITLVFIRRRPSGRTRWLVALTIWLLACLVWLAVPNSLLQNSFYAPIRPPAEQPFPNSDAGYYDYMSQSLLIGYPYLGEIPSRPLYIVFLALLHQLVGEHYDQLIVGQTVVLALIPVLLYMLGDALHSPAAGVIAALAAIAREWTSLLVSSQTRVSNTKMLLTDLPTLLLVLTCCLFSARWLQKSDLRNAILAGGSLGLLLLLRTQAVLILPALMLLALVRFGTRNRSAYGQLIALLGAGLLALAPWLIHNYLQAGQITLDAPFQYRIIASQYRYTGNLDIQNVDLEGKSLAQILVGFMIRDPGFVLGFITNHMLATQVDGLLALPLFHSYNGLLAELNLYWLQWDGSLTPPNLALVLLYLGIIGVGLGAAWKRHRWAGMVPLGFSLAYSLANGIARFSGWRYDLPADWVAYFYFAVGTAEIIWMLAALLGATPSKLTVWSTDGAPAATSSRAIMPILLAFIAAGSLPWMAEGLAPPRYADRAIAALTSELQASTAVLDAGISAAQIAHVAASPGTVIEVGRVLYPRFFTRGGGLASAHPWQAYAPREFPRLGFLLLNGSRHDVILADKQMPQDLEHGADAIVLGCLRDDYIEARLVLVPATGVVLAGPPLDARCP